MNNILKTAHHIPVNDEVSVISVSPVSLPAPDRGMDLEVRISAPVSGNNLPVILLSHGHGPSLYIPSADGYGPIVNFWAGPRLCCHPANPPEREGAWDENGRAGRSDLLEITRHRHEADHQPDR